MSKNKTISFRVNEEAFDALQGIAEERDLSLSAMFRDYVDMLVAHDGRIRVVPEHEAEEVEGEAFPPKVTVPKSFLRDHERLELENEHLREQVDEHKQYITHLRDKIEELDGDDEEEIIHLEDLDGEDEEADGPYRLG